MIFSCKRCNKEVCCDEFFSGKDTTAYLFYNSYIPGKGGFLQDELFIKMNLCHSCNEEFKEFMRIK